MRRDFPMGSHPALLDRAKAWLATAPAERTPVPIRNAATVMVVRDRTSGSGGPVEVFMIHRVSSMVFAPDTLVFPGGGVDHRDGDQSIPWRGANDVLWAGRLGCTAHEAREFVCAAVRELFEETGVLLAGPADGDDLVDTASWVAERAALEARELSLATLLRERHLVLRSDLMRAEAHWVTPEFEARRFDTRIFVAAMPPDQEALDDSSEAASAQWMDPRAALEQLAAGTVAILPPTQVCLEHLMSATSAADFLDRQPVIEEIMPTLVDRDGRYVMAVDTGRP